MVHTKLKFQIKLICLREKNGLIPRVKCLNGSVIKVSSQWQKAPITEAEEKAFSVYIQQECMVSSW